MGSATARPTWKEVLHRHAPLILPSAHDAMTAKLIERAGFPAYQIGGFAMSGARFGFPDIDLAHYGEESAGVRDIVAACSLPVLVDADDGYGDVKNVTRTVRGYEDLGVSALFIEDQTAPKRCGHMSGKHVIPTEAMEAKLRAAVAARQTDDTFLLARTDAIEPLGLDEALRRAEAYLKCGADGVYLEGATSVRQLERIGKAFGGVPLCLSILEGGGKTPWVSPEDLHKMGFSMILYPTSVLFRVARAIDRALVDLKAGRPMPQKAGIAMEEFEEWIGLPEWADIEHHFLPPPARSSGKRKTSSSNGKTRRLHT